MSTEFAKFKGKLAQPSLGSNFIGLSGQFAYDNCHLARKMY